MRNPLRKRLLRELKSEAGKYLVIFLLLTMTIGFVSGFLVADGSMMIAYREGFEKYRVEDGNFRLSEKANKAQRRLIQDLGVTLYDNFYLEEALTNGSTLRIFSQRDQVNLICLMKGSLPEKEGEIVIDRMYADNNGIQPGDVIGSDARSWTVTGLVALPDYSCLFSDNNDTMFDSVKFGVAVVTPEEFAGYREEELTFSYSWVYDIAPENENREKDMAEELMKGIVSEVSLEAFVPRYQNQAIQFTGEDMGSDRAMMIAFLYIVVAIMAFVFGITMSNTISKEANVIGTLRASGYTRGELIRHYMTVPAAVTAAGAVAGNLLGYTLLKDVCVGMYYGSYSLPTYVTVWNSEAFLLTTVVPLLLMLSINGLILHRKLTLSPLKFLRRDLSRRKQRHAFHLSEHIPFFGRFRIRVILQNFSSYVILFVGILFANLLLMFGLIFPAILNHYQQEIENNLLCRYQYLLQIPMAAMDEEHKLQSLLSMMYFQYSVQTENETAEKFSAYSLNTLGERYKAEEVLLYGIEPDSQYIRIDTGEDGVWISAAYQEKYQVEPGDTLVLKEAYEDTSYEFRVAGVYDYLGALAIFMDRSTLNETFDLDQDYFSGYFSDTEITDIDSKYISSVIDLDALTKVSRQLQVSMGSMMYLVNGFAILIFLILVYLLSKMIIEKNAQSISMVKILGYTSGEISRLYILATAIVVVIFLLISLPIEYHVMKFLFQMIMMSSITGWISFYMDSKIYVEMFLMGITAYMLVAALEYRKVRRIPMEEALKNVE
jgi:putative ABC transport system permease protein